jgi:hypothetical protein
MGSNIITNSGDLNPAPPPQNTKPNQFSKISTFVIINFGELVRRRRFYCCDQFFL